MSKAKPKYRLCWWCNRKLQGPYGREVVFEGDQVAIVHASCAPMVVKEHGDVVVFVTCVAGCPCRKHAGEEPR